MSDHLYLDAPRDPGGEGGLAGIRGQSMNIVSMTGAGISAASGLGTFRDTDGLHRQRVRALRRGW